MKKLINILIVFFTIIQISFAQVRTVRELDRQLEVSKRRF